MSAVLNKQYQQEIFTYTCKEERTNLPFPWRPNMPLWPQAPRYFSH